MRFPPDPAELPLRSSRVVDLAVTRVRISSNLETFDAHAYFTRTAPDDTVADHEIHCLDLDRDEFDTAEIARHVDRTLRAKRFRTGYYLNHVFGDPAYLITDGNRSFVFGRRLERTVWPYFVKRLLTDFAVDNGWLHLKAGGFTLPDAGAVLLIGANGGGKTVFLTQACLAGASFLTNTHLLVHDGVAHGVPSAIRVRRDALFGGLIDDNRLTPHIESGDYLAPPELLFPGPRVDRAPVSAVVITDFRPDRPAEFGEFDPAEAEMFLEQFALSVTTYGLKDDLMTHLGGDVRRFAATMSTMRAMLGGLVRGARCYRANVDMLDPAVCETVLKELGRP